VQPRSDGGWQVHARDLAAHAAVRLRARRVVLAAGTLGTTGLLLRCRDVYGLLPQLSPMLGQRFSANGDFIGVIRGTRDDLQPSRGPDVTAILRAFDTEPGFTIALPTYGEPVMAALVRLARDDSEIRPLNGLRRLGGDAIWRLADVLAPWFLEGGPGTRLARRLFAAPADESPSDPRRDGRHATVVFAIGRDTGRGRIVLTRRGRRVDVRWPYESENRELVGRMRRLLLDLSVAYGGTLGLSPTWTIARRPLTVHPLGGCIMGTTPDRGVASPEGEVFGAPGLWIADGSLIQGSTSAPRSDRSSSEPSGSVTVDAAISISVANERNSRATRTGLRHRRGMPCHSPACQRIRHLSGGDPPVIANVGDHIVREAPLAMRRWRICCGPSCDRPTRVSTST
jgi:cholesterol oxidase